VAAFEARWGNAWSAWEGKWRWKAEVVDEGEHLGAFYKPTEEGSGWGRRLAELKPTVVRFQVFHFGSGLKGRHRFRRGRGASQMVLRSSADRGGRRHRGSGYVGRKLQRLQLLGEEEGEGAFSPLYVLGVGGVKP
jgi:hypothetical protein